MRMRVYPAALNCAEARYQLPGGQPQHAAGCDVIAHPGPHNRNSW